MPEQRPIAAPPNKAQRALIDEDIDNVLAADIEWERLAGANVLVSGAGGFLPAYMVETLMALIERGLTPGMRVVAMVRSAARARARFEPWLDRSGLEILEQDVIRPIAAPASFDYVIHAASQASPKYYGKDPIGTAMPNVVGTANLLDLAARGGCRGFLYFSSAEVYGQIGKSEGGLSETEFGPLDPMIARACYAESKRMGETLCAAYHRQKDLRTVIVRPFHTYGPGMAPDDGRVFADFVHDVASGRDIVLNSAGTAERAFCYLADATKAFFLALLEGEPATPYNVGNPDAVISVRGLAELLAGLSPGRKIRILSETPTAEGYISSATQRAVPDITRLSKLGWRPTTGLEAGFKRTIDYYSEVQ